MIRNICKTGFLCRIHNRIALHRNHFRFIPGYLRYKDKNAISKNGFFLTSFYQKRGKFAKNLRNGADHRY
jgi:hypothetical protein